VCIYCFLKNELAFKSARQGLSHPLIGTEPALGISAKIARRMIRNLERNMRNLGSPYVDKGVLRGFLKTLCKKSWEITQPEQKLQGSFNGKPEKLY
jgi:hypothetical protein